MNLQICEIFYSVQGEASFSGQPCVFVRFTGCNLRCVWCDTTYAFSGGEAMTVDEIVARVKSYGCRLVELTGGEPMLQAEGACSLMSRLLAEGMTVLLETNGACALDLVPQSVHRIIDLKAPGSGTVHREDIWNGYAGSWRDTDEVKCVVSGRSDFDWCMEKLKHYKAVGRVIIHFAPVWGAVEPSDLVEWICASHEPVRLSLQIHKVIWDPEARGV